MPDTDKLLAAIDSYAGGAYTQEGELSRQRSLALDAFAGKNIEPAPEGRSQITDWSVFETVMWIMPSLMRIYGGLNGDSVVEFDPIGPEDEDAAEQESEYLNWQVTQKNDWDLTARTWMQDALLTKNAYCMVYMEEKLVPEIERYEGQTQEQVAMILDDDVEVVGQRQYDDPEDEGTVINPLTGEPVQDDMEAQLAMQAYMEQGVEPAVAYRQLFDLEIKRVKPVQKLQFKVLPPERVKVGDDTPSHQIDDDTNYFEYFERDTISNLRKMGYDVDDDIASGDSYTLDSRESESRDEVLEMDFDMDVDSPDPSMRKVTVRTIWIRYDYDEDGIAELLKVVRVGQEILELDHASRIPVACIVPFINTHRHYGVSVADCVFDLQRIKTALLRGGLDSLNLALNPTKYINTNAIGETTIDDLLVSRPGAIVRGELPPGEAFSLMPTENTFSYALEGMSYIDSMKEDRAGVNRMFQGIDASAMSSTNAHNAIGQLSTMAAQRIEDIARVFAGGFKRLFSLAHELIIKHGRIEKTIKLRGNWVDIDPSNWRTGRDMRVVAPFAAGNKDALLNRLMLIVQLQEKAFAAGLPIVDADDAYNLAVEIAKASDVAGTKFFTDPATIPPAEPEPNFTGIALEIENKKADNQIATKEIDSETDRYQADLQAEVDKYRADLQAEVQIALKQLELGGKTELEGVKAALRDAPILDANKSLDKTEKGIQELGKQIQAAVQELKAAQEAPVKVVRKDGRIVGKEVNGKFVPIEDAG